MNSYKIFSDKIQIARNVLSLWIDIQEVIYTLWWLDLTILMNLFETYELVIIWIVVFGAGFETISLIKVKTWLTKCANTLGFIKTNQTVACGVQTRRSIFIGS